MGSKLASRRRDLLASLLIASTLGAWIAACVGDDAAVNGGGEPAVDSGPGGPGVDGSVSPGVDGSVPPGTDAGCTAAACTDNGASLSCAGSKVTCVYGCAPAAAGTDAHCRVFDPTGAVEPSDLSQAGLMNYAGKNLKFFTDTGRITTADESMEIRAANKVATAEEVSLDGIGFRLVPGKLGIFQFKNFTLERSTDFLESNGATGTVALAIVATEEVKIDGLLDIGCSRRIFNDYPAAGSHAGSGQPADNKTKLDGMGPGGGKSGNVSVASGGFVISGGAGGGHALGATGGNGGDGIYPGEAVVFGGTGGASYDDGLFDPPLGGSGGGAGNSGGGGGGGAVQIVAGVRITIGEVPDGGGFSGGINAGGCGGGDGFSSQSAGGGGSGGTILLEAPEVVGKANAGVAANGGGGGGAGGMGFGGNQNGTITTTPAQGTLPINCTGPATQAFGGGGNGGAGTTPSGTTGPFPTGCGSSVVKYGGGGGGAAGRVRIHSASGNITVDPSFVISPSVAPSFQKAKIATR